MKWICERNPKHKSIDDYGCLDCFREWANWKMIKKLEEDENEV